MIRVCVCVYEVNVCITDSFLSAGPSLMYIVQSNFMHVCSAVQMFAVLNAC